MPLWQSAWSITSITSTFSIPLLHPSTPSHTLFQVVPYLPLSIVRLKVLQIYPTPHCPAFQEQHTVFWPQAASSCSFNSPRESHLVSQGT
ncbi:hypothetical protein GGR57DRAFT_475977 [Xylariaceae sp. FL1272]|nr:hypothetical protein GGR57DRAFT_475977 [Xylariaceae sp. FL1272]